MFLLLFSRFPVPRPGSEGAAERDGGVGQGVAEAALTFGAGGGGEGAETGAEHGVRREAPAVGEGESYAYGAVKVGLLGVVEQIVDGDAGFHLEEAVFMIPREGGAGHGVDGVGVGRIVHHRHDLGPDAGKAHDPSFVAETT